MPEKKYTPKLAIDSYKNYASGLSKKENAKALKITTTTLERWEKSESLFKHAKTTGKKDAKPSKEKLSKQLKEQRETLTRKHRTELSEHKAQHRTELRALKEQHAKALKEQDKANKTLKANYTPQSFLEYIHGHLSDDLKDLFNQLDLLDQEATNRVSQFEQILNRTTDQDKQSLLLHAYVKSGFNMSMALRVVRLRKSTLDRWIIEDDNFALVMNEIQWHRKNFVESALFALVHAGDTKAVIFANQCLNRDRGFVNRVEMRVEEIGASEIDWDISDLDLPPDVIELVIDAIEKREQDQKAITVEGGVAE